MKQLDLTNKKFGKLTGVSYAYTDERGRARWVFECECGNKKILSTHNVKQGTTRSCGCAGIKDITGKKYNKLTAISLGCIVGGRTYWKFRCECGTEKLIDAASVKCGLTKGCGCGNIEQSEKKMKPGTGDRVLYSSYADRAKRKGLTFDLTKEQFKRLTQLQCYYCGCEPAQIKAGAASRSKPEFYNGIDRMDNAIGYLSDNCVPCCKHCNRAKMDRSAEDFINHVAKIYRYSILKLAGDA